MGGTIFFAESLDEILSVIEKFRPTVWPSVPLWMKLIATHEEYQKYDISSLKVITCGSAPLPVDVIKRVEELTGAAINGNIELQRDGKAVDREAANKHLMDYMFGKQKKESEEFLAAKKKEEGVKELNGGVLYKVLKAGEGDKKPAATDSVIVKYEGRLADGTVFDSSEHAPEGTATLSLQYMIEGWKIALPEMTVGSEWELYIPAELGYGERGTGPIPPYSALIFKVTLVGIK